jgi:hypothetical protein
MGPRAWFFATAPAGSAGYGRGLVRSAVALAVGLAVASATAVAGAEGARRDPAAADALFQAAVKALDTGDWATACPKFSASYDLDPSPSALLNVAKCQTHAGRLATAWSSCQRALVLNEETPGAQRRAELDAYARKLIAGLEPRLARLRVRVTNAPAGATVSRDGVVLAGAALGEAVPVDAGAHEVVVVARGFADARQSVTAVDGSLADVSITLAPGASSTVAPAAAASAETGARRVPAWVWITAGGGAALVAGGVVFLVDERATQADIDAKCTLPGKRCGAFDPASDNARVTRDFGLFLGLGGAGVAAIGVAAIGFLRAPRAPARASSTGLCVTPYPGGLGLAGAF